MPGGLSTVSYLTLIFCLFCLCVKGELEFLPLTREFIQMLNDEKSYNRYATPTQFNGKAVKLKRKLKRIYLE
jgi:hypothetical protein